MGAEEFFTVRGPMERGNRSVQVDCMFRCWDRGCRKGAPDPDRPFWKNAAGCDKVRFPRTPRQGLARETLLIHLKD